MGRSACQQLRLKRHDFEVQACFYGVLTCPPVALETVGVASMTTPDGFAFRIKAEGWRIDGCHSRLLLGIRAPEAQGRLVVVCMALQA